MPLPIKKTSNNPTPIQQDLHTFYQKHIERIAHDLGSPIAIIDISLRLIKQSVPEKNYKVIEIALDRIRNIADSALTSYDFISSHITLAEIITGIVHEKKYEWQNNPCDITYQFSKETESVVIPAGKTDIERMLSNLLNNAYEALTNKREIIMSLKKEENFILLSLKDTGCGIPQKMIKAVLQGQSLKSEGHGIGLSSAFQYMKSLGGKLKLSSQENMGTEVQLYFPVA